MSVQEHILMATDQDPPSVAEWLANLPGMVISRSADGNVFVSRPAGGGRTGEVGGEVSRNFLADPDADADEASLVDGFTVVWDIGFTGRDREFQMAEARSIFVELSKRFHAPLALLRGLDLLVAAYAPRLGVRWMPPATTPDPEHRNLWLPFAQQLQ